MWVESQKYHLHIELTSKCNSACPNCPRFIKGTPILDSKIRLSEIKLNDIKYVVKSAFSLPKTYYNSFIDYWYDNIKNHDKIAVNSMIENFKPNMTKREVWRSKIFTGDSCVAFNSYITLTGCFIDVKKID